MAKFDKVKSGLGSGLLSDVSKNVATNDFQVTYISIDDIEPNEKNEGFSMDEIEELKASIRDVGLEQNLVVLRNGEKYKILTGHRRYKACCELVSEGFEKYKQLPCVVKDLSKIDLPLDDETKEIYALVTTNVELRRSTDSDRLKQIKLLSMVYDKLKENGDTKGKRRDFIADNLGVSPSTIKILSYIDSHITEDFKQKFNDNEIPLTVANTIAHMKQEEQDKLFNSVDKISELTVDKVNEFKQPVTINKNVSNVTNDEDKNIEKENSYEKQIITKDMFKNLFDTINNFKDNKVLNDNVILKDKDYTDVINAVNNINKQILQIEFILSHSKNNN